MEQTNAVGFRFSNHFGTGDLYLGFFGDVTSFQGKLLFSVAYLTSDADEISYTLEEAWDSDDGTLLILGQDLAVASVFKQGLRDLDITPSTRLVWISNPNAASSEWSVTKFRLSGISDGIRILERDERLSLTNDMSGYCLTFAKGCEFSINTDTSTVQIARGGAAPPSRLKFGRDASTLPLDESGLLIEFAALQGNKFSFGFCIPGGNEITDWLETLDVGLRYSYIRSDCIDSNNEIASVRFPVFAPHKEIPSIRLRAGLVTPQLLNQAISRFESQLSQPTNLKSWFRTVTGRACLFRVTKLDLTFAALPEKPGGMTLAPSGTFDVFIGGQQALHVAAEAARSADDHELLCGSSGAEYIQLPDNLKDYQITLDAGHPAFSPGAFAGPLDGDAALTDTSTTAWVRFSSKSADLSYYAQPEGTATLFDATNPLGDSAVPLLPYFPLIAARIGKGDTGFFLPWVPLAGVSDTDADQARRLEVTAISPSRKARLDAPRQQALQNGESLEFLPKDARFDDENKLTAVTPRGLEAHFVEEGTEQKWESVHIARLQAPNSGELKFAGADGIVEPLLSALLTNQQFLVISDPEQIARFFPPGPETRLHIGGWEFLPHPDYWKAHGTILIVKNADAALEDLAADVGSWTSAAIFNKNLSKTSQELQTIIADAERRVDEYHAALTQPNGPRDSLASDFKFFVDVVVRSADWNGFLFLNTEIGKLPPDLAGLRAGIDDTKFFAHHLGVTQTLFKSIADIGSQPTSMFGLIRYSDHSPGFDGGSNYAFRVEDLNVFFKDSTVCDFRSTIAFYFAELFGQSLTTSRSGEPVDVRMEGVHQRRGDDETYLFSTRDPIDVELGPGPLRILRLLQGEFETLSVDQDEATGWTKTRFSFAGLMELANVGPSEPSDGFDIFSFDELGFSDVAVDMNFKNAQPRKPEFQFNLEPSQLIEAHTTARDGSLFTGFPVKLGRFVSSVSGQPGEQGFMTVNIPLDGSSLSSVWYGVELRLDLGTLSDVAGDAGVTAGLLLAWGKRPDQFLVGLNLPGSGSSSAELSLLGVLKLRMYSLALRRSPPVSSGNQDAKPSWALLMNGMTLKVFGKELPPNGSFDFYLFGNPDPTGSSRSLGWYGAYSRKEDKSSDDVDAVIDKFGWRRIRALQRLDLDATASVVTRQCLLPPSIRRRGRRGSQGTTGDYTWQFRQKVTSRSNSA